MRERFRTPVIWCAVVGLLLILAVMIIHYAIKPAFFPDTSEITWILDQEPFDRLFSVDNMSDVGVKESLELTPIEGSDEMLAEYELEFHTGSSADPIRLSGTLSPESNEELSIYFGVLKGEGRINGVSCQINSVLQKDRNSDATCASFTIVPEYAARIEDFVLFQIGDSFITKDMVPEWFFSEETAP